jgi:hypothetical protein
MIASGLHLMYATLCFSISPLTRIPPKA